MPGGYPPAPNRKPIIILIVMMVLFVVLLSVVIKNYSSYVGDKGASRPVAPPASRRAIDLPAQGAVPAGEGFQARNLEFEGNLTALAAMDGAPLEMNDAFNRLAKTVKRAPVSKLQSRATQLPDREVLLEHAAAYRGMVFTLRVIPAEINPHTNDLPGGREVSWRLYCMAQRSTSEFVVFETLDAPPMKNWIVKRDAIEIDAVFVRTATYTTEYKGDVTVPYLIPIAYRMVEPGESLDGSVGIGHILMSKYGPYVAGSLLLFVGLTLWTIRRHQSQMEKLEREQFYGMMRSKRKLKEGSVAAGGKT